MPVARRRRGHPGPGTVSSTGRPFQGGRSFVTYTAAAAVLLEESRNGELAGEVGRLAVLAGQAAQVRGGVVEIREGLVELAARPGRVGGARHHQGGVVGDVVEPCFFERPPQPGGGRFGGGEPLALDA